MFEIFNFISREKCNSWNICNVNHIEQITGKNKLVMVHITNCKLLQRITQKG